MSAAVRTAPVSGGPGSSRAWGWVAHLEGGGTVTWADWRDQPEGEAGEAPPGARWLPGAQQLELLRRLNLAGRPDRELVRRVLTATVTGRGRHDLTLTGADRSGAGLSDAGRERFAPEPVDPLDLTDDDLLRVAAGLLAAGAAQADSSAVPPGKPAAAGQMNRGVRRIRTRYRLVGDPELAEPRRASLVADGRPPGGKGAAVLVLGTDLATMLGHAWVAGAFAEGGPSWPDYLIAWQKRGGVPRRIDLPRIADRWRAARATGSLDVVLDLTAVPDLLRLRRGPVLATGDAIAAAGAEVARRTTVALGLLLPADQVAEQMTARLRPRLVGASGSPPGVPPEHHGWVVDRALRMRDDLARSGHRVVGDPDALVPRGLTRGSTGADSSPVDIAVELLLAGVR